MTRIPHARGVGKALRGVKGAIVRSVKGLNQAASQRMAKGDYATAETLVAKGKDIRLFQAEVEALGKRWREVSRGGKASAKGTESPLWAYYQLILQALVESGGECRRRDLEPVVERLMSASLQPGDRQGMARGRERWRVMIQRARKVLVSEGWIEARSGKDWRITDAGRRAAAKPVTADMLCAAE
jgi:hypothetical protein